MSEIVMTLANCLLELVFAVAGVVFTTVVIPWIVKSVIPWMKQKHIYSIVQKLVKAAEKQAEAGTLLKADKKAYVIRLLEAQGITVTEEIDAFIEAAVMELDIAINSAVLEIGGVLEAGGDETAEGGTE